MKSQVAFIWYFVFLLSFIFNKGEFTIPGIFILVILFLLIPVLYLYRNLPKINFNPNIFLPIFCGLSMAVYGGFNQEKNVVISYLLLSFSLGTSFLALFINSKKLLLFFYGTIFAVAIILRLLMIWGSPNPKIDVFDFTKIGARDFLKGINPYSNTYTPIYKDVTADYYAYPPGTLFFTLPSVFLFNDPRYTYVAADIIVTLILFNIVKNKKNKLVYPLLFLYNPMALTVLEQSWTEPLLIALIILSIWSLLKEKKILSSIIFGLILGTKQYIILLLPLFIKLFPKLKEKISHVLILFLVFSLVILPFYLWNQTDFLHDTLYFFGESPRYWSLSFTSLFHQLGFNFNSYLYMGLVACIILPFYLQKHFSVNRFLYASAFVLLTFFVFNKEAALNYYYIVGQLLLLGLAFEGSE